jgi:hypothetical protein
MPKSFAAFATAVLLSGSLCMQPSFCAAQAKDAVVMEGPDAEVKEFRLADLEVRLRTMQAGAERGYFAGVLARSESSNPFLQPPARILTALRTGWQMV